MAHQNAFDASLVVDPTRGQGILASNAEIEKAINCLKSFKFISELFRDSDDAGYRLACDFNQNVIYLTLLKPVSTPEGRGSNIRWRNQASKPSNLYQADRRPADQVHQNSIMVEATRAQDTSMGHGSQEDFLHTAFVRRCRASILSSKRSFPSQPQPQPARCDTTHISDHD